jgi:molybdopterin-guanine dinucleotide biosynthesis protein A
MAGIILAGGKGKRLGGVSKALHSLAGKTLLSYVVEKLSPLFNELILVTNTPQIYTDFPGIVVMDINPGYGPLSGIEAGLLAAGKGLHFITGCDMPFLNPRLIKYLEDRGRDYDIVVPRLGHYIEPLHSFYSQDVLPSISGLLGRGNYRLNALLTAPLNVLYVNENEIKKYDANLYSFFNVNTSADVQKAEAMLMQGEKLSGAY